VSKGIVAVLALGLALRMLVRFIAPHPNFVIDEAEYYQIASILADGRGWQFYEEATWIRPPLYLIMLAGSFKLFGHSLLIIRVAQIVISLASVFLLYWLGKRLYGERTGLIAGLLAAIAWPFAVFPYLLLSETLFIFLFLGSVCCFVEFLAKRNSGKPSIWPSGRSEWLLMAGGSVLLGLSALTRGQVLSFVPFLALWFWLALKRNWKTALAAFVIMGLVFTVTISPWLLRNVSLYGRPFIDTTGGYNFYLGALKGRNGALVSQTLEPIKNYAERDALGYQKGLEIFYKDPLDFIFGKGIKESLDFWQINFGADERLLEGYTYGLINPPWLLLDFFLNDVLYLIVGALALVGLVIAPATSRGGRSFVAIWTIQNMILALAFFAVTRFRLSVYFFLLLFAAYVLANWREVLEWFAKPLRGNKPLRWGAGLALPVIFLAVVLPSFSPVATVLGIEKEWATGKGLERWAARQNQLEGDRLRLAGKYPEALTAYASAVQTVPYTQIGIGLTEAAQGKFDDAIGRIGRTSQDIAQSHLALGFIYLQQGNRAFARSEFNSRQVSLDDSADEWAYDNLPVGPLPNLRLELGEYDWGYTSGFQIYEKDPQTGKFYRWTAGRGDDGQGNARLRFPEAGKSQPKEVVLRLRGYRPDNLTPPEVEVYANGQLLGKVRVTRQWEDYSFKLPAGLTGDIIIGVGADTFVPGASSRRELGVMVESAALR
jgi:4-amino-4-deoxy-L-arabinose transferase-like glycosyltransferase